MSRRIPRRTITFLKIIMIKRTLFSSLALATLGGLLFSSCTNSTSPNNPVVGAPSNVMASSTSATSISIEWTRGSSDTGPDTIIVSSANATTTTPTGATDSKATLTGLSEGTPYTITVASTGGRSSITWMTAQRYTGIKIYETSDPSPLDPSALVLASNATDAIAESAATNADFVLKTESSVSSGISLEAGAVIDGSWNDNKVNGRGDYIVGGLSNDYRSTDYTQDMDTASVNAYDVPNDAVYATKGSRVLIVKQQDPALGTHLALIEIVPDAATGKLYSTNASGYKYITVNISYQSVVNQPYAARPIFHGLVPKRLAN